MKKVYYALLGVSLVFVFAVIYLSVRPVNKTGSVKGASTKSEVFIDVRTEAEWEAGHVNNALHFDLADMQKGLLPDLPKNTAIALYCRTGIRAGQALKILEQNGFTHARDAGGFANLQSQNSKICLGNQPSCD